MSTVHTEHQLVDQRALRLFAELGWTKVSALEKTFAVGAYCQRCWPVADWRNEDLG
jgi:hypothetical protein